MTHTCGSRTNSSSFFIPIDIDENNGGIHAFMDKELTESPYLFFPQRLLGMGIGSDRSIDVVPQIGGSLFRHPLDVLTADQFVVVVLADAGGDAEDESCFPTGTDSVQGALIDSTCLTATVTFLLESLNADERGDIACLAELPGDVVGEERAVGEELEVTVAVLGEDVQQSAIHQGFAAQYAEEGGTVAFAFADDAVDLLHRQALPSSLTHPTSAACQVACLRDGNHVEGREERFASLLPLFEVAHVRQIRPAEVPAELPQQPDGGLSEHPPADLHQ